MNLAEMVKNVKGECHPVTNIDLLIRRWLNQGQKIVASKGPKQGWEWLRQFNYTLNTEVGVETYALSPLVDTSKIIQLVDKTADRAISSMTDEVFRTYSPSTTASGSPDLFRLVGYWPVQFQPSSSSVIAAVSDNATDTKKVRVQGLDTNGIFIKETLTLNGTNPVSTSKLFSRIMGLSKDDETAGNVTVSSNAGAVTNVVIAPSDRAIQHPVISFSPIPDDVRPITYDFTMKMTNMTNINDASMVPEQYHDVIELYATYKCYKHLNNVQMWQATQSEFNSRIQDLISEGTQPNGVFTLGDFDDTGLPEAQLPSNFPRDY